MADTTRGMVVLAPAPPTDDTGRYFMTVREASRRLCISRSSAYLLVQSGELRTIPYGSRQLVPIDAVEECARNMVAGRVAAPSVIAAGLRVDRTRS